MRMTRLSVMYRREGHWNTSARLDRLGVLPRACRLMCRGKLNFAGSDYRHKKWLCFQIRLCVCAEAAWQQCQLSSCPVLASQSGHCLSQPVSKRLTPEHVHISDFDQGCCRPSELQRDGFCNSLLASMRAYTSQALPQNPIKSIQLASLSYCHARAHRCHVESIMTLIYVLLGHIHHGLPLQRTCKISAGHYLAGPSQTTCSRSCFCFLALSSAQPACLVTILPLVIPSLPPLFSSSAAPHVSPEHDPPCPTHEMSTQTCPLLADRVAWFAVLQYVTGRPPSMYSWLSANTPSATSPSSLVHPLRLALDLPSSKFGPRPQSASVAVFCSTGQQASLLHWVRSLPRWQANALESVRWQKPGSVSKTQQPGCSSTRACAYNGMTIANFPSSACCCCATLPAAAVPAQKHHSHKPRRSRRLS